MDQRPGNRGADRLPSPVQPHRDGERAAVPGRIGAPLSHREHADVEGAVRQPGDKQRRGNQPDIAGENEERDRKPGNQVGHEHHQTLPSLAVDAPGDQRGRNRGEAIDSPQSAHQGRIAVQSLQHQHRYPNQENAEAEIQHRRGQSDPTECCVVNQHIFETGPRISEDGARYGGSNRLGKGHDQYGRQQKDGSRHGEGEPRAGQGGQHPG
ncbi:MAG TPA: hypothetical protein VN913_10090 [Candidatus Binatus sp.]|nr:hypothetical protein [Candidatus Binatus sp.]